MKRSYIPILIMIIMVFSPVAGLYTDQFASNTENDNNNKMDEEIKKTLDSSRKENNQDSNSVKMDSTDDLQIDKFDQNLLNSNQKIGNNTGSGAGSYDVNDIASLTHTEVMSTQSSFVTLESQVIHDDSWTYSNPSNFNRGNSVFNITNAKAEEEWRIIEDQYNARPIDSNFSLSYIQVAMEITIPEPHANITSVYLYHSSVQENAKNPSGQVYIVNSTAGAPDETKILSSKEDLLLSSAGWYEYTFNSPVTLKNGISYYVVLNDTTKVDGYWNWYYQTDAPGVDDGVDDGQFYHKQYTHGSSWATDSYDLLLQVKVQPLDESQEILTYNSPEQIAMTYNTSVDNTTLKSFNFVWNNTNKHNFYTNVSVSFSLNWEVDLSYSANPIVASSNFFVTNSTYTMWNVSFVSEDLITSYNIRNRTFSIENLNSDWNGTIIYWNGTQQYSNLDTNAQITYTNGSSTMAVNASTLSTAKYWEVAFLSPNYISLFTLDRGISSLTLPYKANITDVLTPVISILDQTNGNATLRIEDPDEVVVQRESGFTAPSPAFSDWDINATITHGPNKFGIYNLECFWINTNNDRVGYSAREVQVYINTTLDAPLDVGQHLKGTNLDLSVYYGAIHNTTGVDGASVTATPSWTGVPQAMTQSISHGNYTISLDTSTAPLGTRTVEIDASRIWHVNRTVIVSVDIVENTTLTVTTDKSEIYFGASSEVRIRYEDSSNAGINGAQVLVNSSSDGVTEPGNNGTYFFTFDSTIHSVGLWYLIIEASQTDYKSRAEQITIQINTTLTTLDVSIANETVINNRYTDTYSFDIRFNDSIFNQVLDAAITVSNPTNLNLTRTGTHPDYYTYTFEMNITGLGQTIHLTFSKDNYETKTFEITFNVEINPTSIDKTSGTINIFYLDEDSFNVIFSDTNHSLNVLDAIVNIEGALYFEGGNETGVYAFRFNETSTIGTFNVNITFQKTGYEPQYLLLEYVVNPRTTALNLIEGGFANDTVITLLFDNNHSFVLQWQDTNGTVLMITPTLTGDDLTYTSDPLYYNFTFDAYRSIGFYQTEIRVEKYGYINKSWIVQYNLLARPTTVSGVGSQPANGATVYYNFSDIINYAWQWVDDNTSTPIQDVSSVTTDPVAFSYIDDYYNFTFTYSDVGTTVVEFQLNKYGYQNITYSFTIVILTTPTELIGQANDTIIVLNYLESDTFNISIEDLAHAVNLTDMDITITGEIVYLGGNGTGNYQFIFNKSRLQIGSFNLNITFQKTGYETQYLLLEYVVNPRTTVLNLVEGGFANDTVITLLFDNDHSFVLQWQDTNGTTLMVTPTLIGDDLTYIGDPLYYNFTFDAYRSTGFYQTEIQVNKYGYVNKSWVVQYNLLARPTILNEISESSSINGTTVSYNFGDAIQYEWEWVDDNSSLEIQDWQTVSNSSLNYVNLTYYQFMFNYTNVGTTSVSFALEKFGYQNISYSFTIQINGTFTEIIGKTDGTINLLYLQEESFNFVYNDTEHDENLTDATIIIQGELIYLGGNDTGIYQFIFNKSQVAIGVFDVTITVSKQGYEPVTLILTYNVAERPTEINRIDLPAQDGTESIYYGENISFSLTWNSTTEALLLASSSYLNVTGISYLNDTYYEFECIFNQEYTGVTTIQVIIELKKFGYQNHTLSFTIEVEAAPSDITPELSDTVYTNYTLDQNFWLVWTGTVRSESLVDNNPEIVVTNAGNVSLVSITGDQMNFMFLAETLGTYDIEIILDIPNYESRIYQLTVVVNELSTQAPHVTDSYPEVYESEILNISLQWQQNEVDFVYKIESVVIEINNSVWRNYNWNQNGTDVFLNIDTANVKPGNQSLEIRFGKYGYEDQSVVVEIVIRPHEVSIDITLPQAEISQGNVFRIIVYVSYTDPPIIGNTISFGMYNGKVSVIPIKTGDPVNNGSVQLSFIIVNEDETQDEYSQVLQTNASGYAVFEIPASITQNAIEIRQINAEFLGNDFSISNSKTLSLTLPVKGIVSLEDIMLLIEENIVIISVGLIILLAFLTISVRQIRKRRRVKRQKKERRLMVQRSFKSITSVQAIICRHHTGVPFYTENLFEDQTKDPDAIAGVTMAISSFIEELGKTESKEEIEVGTFERMEQSGFNMLSHNLKYSSLVLISKSKQTKFIEKRFKQAHKMIESEFKDTLKKEAYIPNTVDEEKIQEVLDQKLLLAIVKPLTVDTQKLKENKEYILKESRKILAQYEIVPSFSEYINVFFVLTFVSTMKNQGFKYIDIITAVIEGIDKRILKSLSYNQIEMIGKEQRLKNSDHDQE